MVNVWISQGQPDRLVCDVEVCEFGAAWLVRFRHPDMPFSHAIQAAVSVGVSSGMTGIVETLVALGFAKPVAQDASAFVRDLLIKSGAQQNEARAKDVLRRVEFKQ